MSGSFNFAPGANNSYSFGHFYAGRIAPSTVRAQLPNIPCEMALLKADPDNGGNIYIGGEDVSSGNGLPLAAGDVTGWIPIKNLNLLWCICSVAGQNLSYMIVW